MSGPAPKPTALKRLAGNPGKRPLNDAEPEFDQVLMHAPDHLSERARVEWKRLKKQLMKTGLLTIADRAAFAIYCQAVADLEEAEEYLDKNGKVLVTDKGYEYLSPWVSVKNNAIAQIDKFGAKFGLSPSDRSRIKLPEPEKVDPFEEFVKQRLGD